MTEIKTPSGEQPGTHENTPAGTPPAAAPLRVGITHGDTNGVGYEVIFKAFAEPAMLDLCTPIIYGAAKVAAIHRKAVAPDSQYQVIATPDEAVRGRLNLISCFDEDLNVEFGKATPEAGHAAFVALERATEDLRAGDIDVLVTAPICKSAIHNADFRFPGHTEYLSNRCGEDCEPLMVLCNDMMRVALVTTHLPIQQVAGAITTELIAKRIRQLYRSLRHDFLLSAPRIAVLGLNPHSGDCGTLGQEEQDIVAPAIREAVEEGIPVFGPYPADGFFGAGQYTHFDAVLAMYHDQGLAPFKALSMSDGVNFTAGLPFVRTSPDHGTAFDIAGRGTASAGSLRQAVFTAIDIHRNRAADDAAYASPLPKLYRERREEGDRQRHVQSTNAPQQ